MKKEPLVKMLSSLVAAVSLLVASRAQADALVYWSLDYSGFNPGTVVIAPGAKVSWYNVDPYGLDTHVYFDNGFNFALPNSSGMAVTFNVGPGVYGYQDDIGDTAAVVVNLAPTVAVSAPTNHAVLPAPATFTVRASASDTADDSVNDVAFYLGTTDSTNLIEDVYSAPFSTTITDLAAGTYTLIAVATDSHGWTGTDAITITVGAGPAIQLNSPRTTAGKFLFDLSGLTAGKTNIVEWSADLVSWSPLATNIAAAVTLTMTNTPTATARFFRASQLP